MTSGADPRTALDVFAPVSVSRLRFARQLGVRDVVVYGHTYTEPAQVGFLDLLVLRRRIESFGLRLVALESFPASFSDKIMFGRPGRDEQLATWRRIVRDLGRAGIGVLGYHWMPTGVWRTTYAAAGPGGSLVTAFDADLAARAPLIDARPVAEHEMWDHYRYFLEAVLPVAEEEGVVLALHPNDPPIGSLAGVPCLLRDPATVDRALALRPSAAHRVILCLGTFGAMEDDLLDLIAHFGAADKIAYVHFQATNGTVPRFSETFLDHADTDPLAIIQALRAVGFAGVMMPGHVPQIEGDTEWRADDPGTPVDPAFTQPVDASSRRSGHRARAYTFGYLHALIHTTAGPINRDD